MTVRVYSLADDIWAVAPEGRINVPIARALEDALTGLLDEGRKWVVVDLSAASYITSLGLKVLLVAQRRARALGGDVQLAGLGPRMNEIFEMAGFEQLFKLHPSAAEEFVTREQYERFMRPYDLALLEAIRGRGDFHVLHAHGARLYFQEMLDYPVDAISWADREGGPSLAAARGMTRLALMGGIAHGRFAYTSAAAIRREIRAAVAEAGREKLFLAPGCALATYTFPELIRAARDEARR